MPELRTRQERLELGHVASFVERGGHDVIPHPIVEEELSVVVVRKLHFTRPKVVAVVHRTGHCVTPPLPELRELFTDRVGIVDHSRLGGGEFAGTRIERAFVQGGGGVEGLA